MSGNPQFPVIWTGTGNLVTSDGNRVNAGNCDANGVNVNNNRDDNRNDNIGVGASRKFPN